jgi:hypothetical protein
MGDSLDKERKTFPRFGAVLDVGEKLDLLFSQRRGIIDSDSNEAKKLDERIKALAEEYLLKHGKPYVAPAR